MTHIKRYGLLKAVCVCCCILLFSYNGVAQQFLKKYSVKNGSEVIELSKDIPENELDAFIRDFDLAELYARKLRKRLYEEKGAFSDANFFQPVYDEINKEFVDRHTAAGKETDLGKNRDKLNELRAQVMQEIDELPDFCKTCKPSKKKNKKA